MEGFFDLAGLQLPNGSSAQYQLTVEPIDPRGRPEWGRTHPGWSRPLASFQPIIVTVTAGQDVAQDILMSAQRATGATSAVSSLDSPAAIPPGGDWMGSLSGYGDMSVLPACPRRRIAHCRSR